MSEGSLRRRDRRYENDDHACQDAALHNAAALPLSRALGIALGVRTAVQARATARRQLVGFFFLPKSHGAGLG